VEENETSQVEGGQVQPESGATPQTPATSQTPAQPGVTQTESTPTVTPSAPATSEASPAKFTREDVEKMISEKTSVIQKETAQWKQQAHRIALEQQAAQLAQQEMAERAQEKQAIESGAMTAEEATARQRGRAHLLQQQVQAAQMQETLSRQAQHGDQLGRIACARETADEVVATLKKQGIAVTASTAEQLADMFFKDKNIKTPDAMKARAYQVAMQYLMDRQRTLTAKPETFDKGPGDNSGPTTEEQRLKSRYPSMYK